MTGGRWISTLAGVSAFWIALSLISDGVTTLVLPHRLATINIEHRATVLGGAAFVGIALGMVTQPLAGFASDRLARRRRTAALALGVAVTAPALALLVMVSGLVEIVIAFALVQIGANIAQAGQQGLIPDVVPHDRRGIASGVKGFADLAGAVLAFAGLGALLAGPGAGAAVLAIIAVAIVCLFATAFLVPERDRYSSPPGVRWRDVFTVDLRAHRRFAIVVASRFLFLLGTFLIGRFLLYFVADRLSLDSGAAVGTTGALLGGLTLVAAVAALAGGWAADRWGRSAVMVFGAAASAVGALLLIAASTSGQILAFGSLMAIGSGAFAAANWALTTELAPPGEAARFMALANFGTAGAAATAGLAGPIVDWGNARAAGLGYEALFFIAALAFTASALALRGLHTTEAVPGAAGAFTR